MERFQIPQTERSPLVDFDFANRRLRIVGESYPEDPAAFFGPLIAALDQYLKQLSAEPNQAPLVLDLKMTYFNSSSAKALMNIFQHLESAARAGLTIQVNWHYQADDETMMEFGEDFSEDLEAVRFELCPHD